MGQSKIKVERWLPDIKIVEQSTQRNPDFFKVEGFSWERVATNHGRSMGRAYCPCCGGQTYFYIWSISGSGKKCDGCGVVMYLQGVYIDGVTKREYGSIIKSKK